MTLTLHFSKSQLIKLSHLLIGYLIRHTLGKSLPNSYGMADLRISSSARGDIFYFGSFQLQPDGILLKQGKAVALSPKERDVLTLLVQAEGQIVEKDDVLQTVWNNEEVSESSLTRCIHFLRQHLNPESSAINYIETVYGRGYRLNAAVTRRAGPQQRAPQSTPGQNPRLWQAAQTAPHVYEAYLEARQLVRKRNAERMKRAIELYQLAIQWDPNYAPAYVGLADCYGNLVSWSALTVSQGKPLIEAALSKAESIDPDTPGIKVMRAAMTSALDWQFAVAESQFQAALSHQTTDSESLLFYARHLLAFGKPDAAVRVMQTVVELDPLSPLTHNFYAFTLHFARQPEASLNIIRHAVDLDANGVAPLGFLCLLAASQGLHAEALDVGQKVMLLAGKLPMGQSIYAYACARAGLPEEAQPVITAALEQAEFPCRSFVVPVAAALKDGETAALLLERSFGDRCPWLPVIIRDPRLDPIRSDPQVAQVLQEIERHFEELTAGCIPVLQNSF